MRRLGRLAMAFVVFVVAGVTVLSSDSEWAVACSCGDGTVYATFDAAGLAFVGTPTGIDTDASGTYVTFAVERWVRGTGGDTVQLQLSQISGSLCGDMSVPFGETVGVITNVPAAGRPTWPQLCSNGLQSPELLDVLAAGTMPAPTGVGAALNLLDLRHETGMVVLLDAGDRPLAYVDGLEGPLSVCPGGATFTAGTATASGMQVHLVNVSSLSVRPLGTPDGFAAEEVSCVDADGTLLVVGRATSCVGGVPCPQEYRQWDGDEWVVYAPLPDGHVLGRNGREVASLDGQTLTIWSLPSGSATSTIVLPPFVGQPTLSWVHGSPDLSTVYLAATATTISIVDTAVGTTSSITIIDPPLGAGGQPLTPYLHVLDDVVYVRYMPAAGGDVDGNLWFILGADGTLTATGDPYPRAVSGGGILDLATDGPWLLPLGGTTAVASGACGTSAVTIGSFECTPLVIPPTA